MRKKAFTLVELLIVISILGIMAAIALPLFQGNLNQAKEAAAKDNLRILRTTIETYTAKHNDVPPGYQDNDPSKMAGWLYLREQMLVTDKYLNDIPENPFNGLMSGLIIANATPFPGTATGLYGWVYKPETMTIKLDWPGTDSNGVAYFDY